MTASDFAALENIEFDACTDLYRAAPDNIRTAYDVDVRDVAGATCLSCREIEPAMIFRRAVRVGVGRASSEIALGEVIDYMQGRGERFAIPVAADAQPAELSVWLERRGFTRGYAWMKFSRRCDDSPDGETDLDIRVIDSALGGEFGRVVCEAFGLPAAIAPWIGALPGRPNWVCVMAFDGDTPVACGATYVKGDYAWLGFGGTLAAHRRHGAQNALIARRLGEAAARGARVAVTETGERLPDLPSNSYRNILRAGFRERYLRQNYLSPEPGE